MLKVIAGQIGVGAVLTLVYWGASGNVAAYSALLGKVALTVIGLIIVFVAVRPLAAVPFFAGFVLTTLVPLAGLLFRDKAEITEEAVNRNGD